MRTMNLEDLKNLSRAFARNYPTLDRDGLFPAEELKLLKDNGFLEFAVPERFGGPRATWKELVHAIQIVAQGNPSLAQMMIGHYCVSRLVLGEKAPKTLAEKLFAQLLSDREFIAFAHSERSSKTVTAIETKLTHSADGKQAILNGTKFFCTGAKAADHLLISAMEGEKMVVALVPTRTSGLVIRDDWDALGQRSTASGTMELNDVRFDPQLVFRFDFREPTFLYAVAIQSCFSAVFLGAAQGAMEHALGYVKTKTRPRPKTTYARAVEDPNIIQAVGRMQVQLRTAEAMLHRAAQGLDLLEQKRSGLSSADFQQARIDVDMDVGSAKVVCGRTGVQTCQEVFEVCGARITLRENNFDRFWRDVRTLTLHDPLDNLTYTVGSHLLQGTPLQVGLF